MPDEQTDNAADTTIRRTRGAQAAENIAASKEHAAAEAKAAATPASISAAPAGKLEASGTFIEDGAKKLVEVDHPAIDNNPRAGTTVRQNAIDMNDPTLLAHEAVSQNLAG